jgi:hypothetical protein
MIFTGTQVFDHTDGILSTHTQFLSMSLVVPTPILIPNLDRLLWDEIPLLVS